MSNKHDTAQILGQNIKQLRESIGLTQESLASYLNISREMVAYYETGSRTVSLSHLTKLADLFCVNENQLFEKAPEQRQFMLAFAFRADSLQPSDLESIATFKKVVRNYVQMKNKLSNE